MFDYVELEATTVPFSEFMSLQRCIMGETAHDEGYSSLDEWAAACPRRFQEVSQQMRETYKVYNLK